MIAPGAVIGILGGGQLGRMLALAAARLGYRCHIYEPSTPCPAGEVAARHIAAPWSDEGALAAFAAGVDVVTLEFENVPVAALSFLAGRIPVRPGVKPLSIAQDRIAEKSFLRKAGVATAPWVALDGPAQLAAIMDATLPPPAILKAARFGYDGKGQMRIAGEGEEEREENASAAWQAVGAPDSAILEGEVPFVREISVLAARGTDGHIACYEPVENRHRAHILHRSIVPANLSRESAEAALAIARKLAVALDYIGLLAVEMFVLADGAVLVNEIAPRPHNSGHWTIEGAQTSQFEQTVRAVCGLPLGDCRRLGAIEMTNLIGDEAQDWTRYLGDAEAHLHLYGKRECRPGRKMGHVTRVLRD